jgi:hypothetical protein
MSNPGPVFSRVAAATAARNRIINPTRTVAAIPAQAPWPTQGYWLPPSHTWGGRAISRWCRWGFWEPDGSALNVTRIL